MITKITGMNDVKVNAVNNIIDKWNNTKVRVQESDKDFNDIFKNFWMNCIDCALSDLVCNNNPYECSDDEYEERIEDLKEAVLFEVEKTIERGIDVKEARAIMYPHLA